jgi:N6-L-threonylcarbamoyladenine synthase
MIILGIETSCDETALALIETEGADRVRVIASLVHSQAELHSAYGGVYPTLAKREHGKNLVPLLHKLLAEADGGVSYAHEIADGDMRKTLDEFRAEIAPQNPELYESFAAAAFLRKVPRIDRIAVTEGPGLEPALWVGINFARMLSSLWGVLVVAVDHMEGHVVASLVPSDAPNGEWQTLVPAPMPAVAFLISGGHTELVRIDRLGSYTLLGETQDDAVGEAFDKAARLLGLSYPGGPHLSELAGKAREQHIAAPVKLPRPMKASGDLNFSFSGLKTAVLYAVRSAPKDERGVLDESWKKGLAREFEDAVVETLSGKLRAAVEQTGAQSIIAGGGVVANHMIRAAFKKIADEYGIPLLLPSGYLSGDNALMIAVAGSMKKATAATALRASGTKRLTD